MFFDIVLTPISTTSGIEGTGNTRKYHQIDVYIYQCVLQQDDRYARKDNKKYTTKPGNNITPHKTHTMRSTTNNEQINNKITALEQIAA